MGEVQCQFRWASFRLRKCPGLKDRAILLGRPALPNQQNDVLSALQARLEAREILLAVHRLLVDFEDDVAAAEVNIFGERARLHILHDDAPARRNVEAVSHLRRHFAHGHAHLALLGRIGVSVVLLIAQAGGEKLGAVGDGHARILRFAVAHKSQRDFRARLARSDVGDEFRALADFLAVNRGNGVADLQSSLIGGTAGHDARYGHARSRAVHASDGGILHGVKHDADRTALYTVLGAGELVVNIDDRLRGQSESDAGVGIGLAENCGIDADDFAIHVDQRAARVAGIDGRVGLNEALELAIGDDVAASRRDDSGGDGANLSEGTADGKYPVADLHAVGVPHLRRRQWVIHVNFDYGEIGFLIGAHHLGFVLHARRIFLEAHANAVRLFDDVAVGDDVSLGVNHNARTERTLTDGAIVGGLAGRAEEVVEEIIHATAATTAVVLIFFVAARSAAPAVNVLDGRFSVDVHDAGAELLGNRRESVGQLRRVGHGQRGRVTLALSFFALYAVGNHGADENAERERYQNTERVDPTVGLEAHPHRAQIHMLCLPPKQFNLS